MAFTTALSIAEDKATIEICGELDSASAPRFHEVIENAIQADISCLELRAKSLTYMSSAGLRAILFARQKMGDKRTLVLVGAPEPVTQTIRLAGLDRAIHMADT